jgi:hypothetical protein
MLVEFREPILKTNEEHTERSTRPVTEISTGNLPGGKEAAGAYE